MLTHPAVHIAYALLIGGVMAYFLNAIFSTIYDRDDEEFANHRQSISIFDTSIQFGEEKAYRQGERISIPTVSVIGYIENDSPITWTGAVIEARFFDDKDQLIDTGQTQQSRLVIPERDVCTFKVSYELTLPKEEYSKVSAKIVFADDEASRWPW